MGLQDDEFCKFDRAMIFEDPNGTRILYDAGRTVAGADDPRLGKIDVLLVSHMHGDHEGVRHQPKPGVGSCGKPDVSVKAMPNTFTVNFALAKKTTIVMGSEMRRFFGNKLIANGVEFNNSQLARFGSLRKFGGVMITTVPAVHSNGVNPAFIGGDRGKMLKAAGLAGYADPPTGYVIELTNGPVVYFSGNTRITVEQDSVLRGHCGAKLAGSTSATCSLRGLCRLRLS